MKRTLFVAAVVLGFATAASAATLTISSDKTTYFVGETITLTLAGVNEGESTTQVYAAVTYEAALTETVSSSQEPHQTSFGTDTWTQGVLPTSDGFAALLNQLAGTSPDSVYTGTSTATATLIAEAVGTVNVAFVDDGGSATLDYFGLTSAPGTSFNIIVPEPTVASLIGLGLIGLAVGGRRRRS